MKSQCLNSMKKHVNVTPLVGVWIEIKKEGKETEASRVTPLVGVWIEIIITASRLIILFVTPLVGVWIEI